MKKLLFIVAACVTAMTVNAQTKDLDNLSKRLVKSDETIADVKKMGLSGTWVDRANILLEASKAYTKMLIADFSMSQTLAMIPDSPQSQEEVEISGAPFTKYTFTNFDVYVDGNGQVAFWETKKEFREGALEGAFDALKKAYQINPAELSGKGYLTATNLVNEYQTIGMNYYNMGKKEQAAETFLKGAEVSKLMGEIDTTLIFFAGIAYMEAEEFDKAVTYLKEALDAGYEDNGNTAYYISLIYKTQDKDEEAMQFLESTVKKYPGNDRFLTDLIDLYLQNKKNPDMIIPLLQQAKELSPENINLFMLEGQLWDELGDPEKSEQAFEQAIQVDPNNYIAYMNIGILQANKGDELVRKAKELDPNDQAGQDALVAQAQPYYDRSIEVLEKAHELNKGEIQIVELLRSLYFTRRDQSPELGEKYKHYTQLYNGMQ